MTAFLSTINKQFIFARGMAIALFAGLFILVACGGGGVSPNVALNVTVVQEDLCKDNSFANGCLDAGETARTREFDDCRTALESGEGDCKKTIPLVAITCLRNPFDADCNVQTYETEVRSRLTNGDSVTKLQASRIDDCKTRLTGDTLCGGAVLNVCGTPESATDSLLFSEDFCHRAEYNDRRGVLVADCLASLHDGNTCAVGVPDLAVTCLRNPFDATCIETDYTAVVRSDSAVTLSKLRDDRISDCKTRLTSDTLCGGAVINECGTVANAMDSLLFNDDFCDRAEYNPSRGALVTDCLESLQGGNTCDSSLVPQAVINCITDFGTDCSDTQVGEALARTNTTQIALENQRKSFCEGNLENDLLCKSIITTECNSLVGESGAMRMGLVNNPLCLGVRYGDARIELFRDCNDADTQNNAGCTQAVIDCVTNPFADTLACRNSIYDGRRADECFKSPSVSGQCTTAPLVADYCANNLFSKFAGCSGSGYNDDRVSYCIDGTNNRKSNCKNTLVFADAQIACFANPYDTGCDTVLDDDGDSSTDTPAQVNRLAYCGSGAAGVVTDNSLCDGAVADVCGKDAFNAFCFADSGYQATRESTCRADSADIRCPATITSLCTANPFTQTTGGSPTNICTGVDDTRVALIGRCSDADNSNNAGCDASVTGGVSVADCLADPHRAGCADPLFNSARDVRNAFCATGDNSQDDTQCGNARVGNPCIGNPFGNDILGAACDATTYANPRYDYCEGEAPIVSLCGEVVARICVADTGEANPRANPFAPICRLSNVANLETEQTNFCNVAGRTGVGNCDIAVQTTCGENPFHTDCFDGSTYAFDRATLIELCEGGDTATCNKSIDSTLTIGMCIDNLFNADCGAGFESLRVEHCSDTATTFSTNCDNRPEATLTRTALIETCRANDAASGCDGFANGGTTGALIADCAANPFNRSNDCNSNQSFQSERDARRTLCSSDATLFNSLCDGLDPAEGLNVAGARIALAEACLLNQLATGCDSFIDGEDGLTVAQCSANPLNTANGCNGNAIFTSVRNNLTTRCTSQATQFESLCDGFADIDSLRRTFCTTGEGSFDDRCDENYSLQAADARKAFIVSCRDDNPAPSECASLIIADGVTIADCIKNPYHRVCYGTENKRNPDFIDEVVARDALCASADTFFSSLCNNGIFGGLDVDAARLAHCNNPATTFDANCNEATYTGTDDTRETLIIACRGATVDAPVTGCDQVVANQQDVGRMVNDCIDVTGGDPYQTGCSDSLFEDDRDSRLELCTQGANASNSALCGNASGVYKCLADPFSVTNSCASNFDLVNAQIARRNYCKDEVKTSDDSLCNASLIDMICDGVEPDDNPFSTLCGNPAVVTDAQQNFCTLAGPSANNPLCSSNEAEVCPKNPFESSFGIQRLVCNGANYADDRIRQCSDGTQNDATRCNTTEIAPVVCKGTGVSANPFAAFCAESLVNAGLADTAALDAEKLNFANACAGANTEGYSCNLAQATFCVADGTYARPFAATCNDAALTDTIGGIRASFCGTGNAGTTNSANCITAIGADCVNNPFGAACVSPSVAELRTLRASYCNSFGTAVLALADALCTSDTAEAVCKNGYGGFDASPFDLICGLDATYDAERTTACLGAPMTADNGGEGRCRNLIMNFCGDSTASDGANPFNSNCTSGDYGDYEDARRTACRAPSNPHECGNTIQIFCGTTASPLINASNVDDDLCAGADLEVARGKACAGITDAMIREDKCGAEDGTGDWAAYCQTDIGKQNAPICPIENGKFAENTCTNTNPFASVCDGNSDYIAARSSRCVSSRLAQNSVALPDGVTDSDCEAAETLICTGGISGALTVTDNPFDPICGASYEQARAEACGPTEDIGVNSECPTIVGSFCGIDGNEFSSACTENSVAKGYRDSKCLATATDETGSGNDCSDAYVRICTANPFSTKNDGVNASICEDVESTTTYADSRKTACETDNTAKGANSGTCAPVIVDVCGAEDTITKGGALFTEPLCNSGDTTYDKSRRLACEDDLTVNQAGGCAATVELTCGVLGTPDVAKLFSDSSLCGVAYNDDRETACSAGGGAEKGDCTNTITRICVTEDKIFNSVCRDVMNITTRRTEACQMAYVAECESHTQFTQLCDADPLGEHKVQCARLTATHAASINTFCGDVTNSANAFTDGCESATYTTTTYSDQLDKACAEGGSAADDACTAGDKARLKRYCAANPYAILTGCTDAELGAGVIAGYQSAFCEANTGDENCSDEPVVFCPVRPFDSECVDESNSTTYADFRKGRADKCRDSSQRTGLDCSAVDTCNARPYGTSAGFTPDNGTALTCDTDPAFDGAKTELIGRCALGDKAVSEQECIDAIADGATCLTDPYGTGCETQLLNAGNVTTAKNGRNAYCVTDGADSSLCSSSALDVVCTASESPFATLCVAAGAGATYRAARVEYCGDSAQTFYTICDEFVAESGVESARGAFCALNGNTVNKGNGDETIDGGILFNAVCNSLPLATTARVNACKVDADAFLFKCDVVQGESDVIAARARVCVANTPDVSRGAVDTSDILFNETLCGISLAGVRDARVSACGVDGDSFLSKCNAYATESDVIAARGRFCAGDPTTLDRGAGEETFADGILFDTVCNSLPLATTARVNVCKVAESAFLTKCDVVENENDVMTARAGVCAANTPNVIRGAVDTSDILFNETLCGNNLAGVTDARVDFCDEDATTFLSKCDIVEDELAVMTARGRVCARKPGTLIRGAGVDNITGDVLFNEVCNDLPLATAERVNVCEVDADSFLSKCDVVQGESDVMTARARVCVANMPDVSRGDGNTIASDVLFDTLCNGLDGVTTARTSACLENDANRDCTGVFGDGFTAWVGVTNDGKTTINAGGAVAGDVDANFIRVQIKTDGTLNLGEGITPDNQTILTLNDTGLSSDTDSGFALASANFGDDGGQDNINLYVGLLHTTTDLGGVASLDTTATATWHGSLAILQQNDDSTLASYNSDFALTVDFDNNSLRGQVLNVGNVVGVDFALGNNVRFDRTSGLISGDATLSKTTRDSDSSAVYSAARSDEIYPTNTKTTATTTATLRGIIGTEGAVATFAGNGNGDTEFGDIVGGFAVSPVTLAQSDCLTGNPFADGCATKVGCSGSGDVTMCDLPVGQILTAQLAACTTGKLPDGTDTPNFEGNCTDDVNLTEIDPAGDGVQTRVRSVLSGVLCSLDHENANPLAKICGSITDDIFYTDGIISGGETQHMANLRKTRAGIESACNNGSPTLEQGGRTATIHENVCRRVALAAAKDAYDTAVIEADREAKCVLSDLPTLFGNECADGASLILRREYCYKIANAFDTTYCIVSDVAAIGVDIDTVRGNQAEACRFSGTGNYATIQSSDCMAQHIKDALCGATFTEASNPFHATCAGYASIETTRSDFAFKCVNNKNRITDTPADCETGNFALCITNPFATDASVPNKEHTSTQTCASSPAFSRIQGKIIASCRQGDITYSSNCGHASTYTCPAFVTARSPNLFIDAICRVNTDYDTARAVILTDCGTMGDCDTFRVRHPNDTNSDYLTTDGRLIDCQDPALAVLDGCDTVLNRPTTAAVLEAFDRNGAKVSTEGDSSKEQLLDTPSGGVGNEFLIGQLDTENYLNTSSYVNKDGTTASSVYNASVGFTLGQHDEASADSRIAGVAYFAGRASADAVGTEVRYFAGLLPYTDFGVALPTLPQAANVDLTADWTGRFGWVVYDAADNAGYTAGTDTGFTLTVNFTARTISGTATRSSDNLAFVVSGDYDDKGLIDGGINIGGTLYAGELIGAIGEFGAAGAFHASGSGLGGAAGGFAVYSNNGEKFVDPTPLIPTILASGGVGTYGLWAFDIQTRDSVIQQLIGGTGLLQRLQSTGALSNEALGVGGSIRAGGGVDTTTPFRLSLDGTFLGGDVSDGVAYFTGTRGGLNNYHAGLFATTDVGALLPTAPAEIVLKWTGGSIGYVVGVGDTTLTHHTGTFTLSLNLDARTFAAESFAGITGIEVSGSWNAANGLIADTSMISFNDGASTFTLTGVVGEQGAIGAFVGSSGTTHYAGGFVANAPMRTATPDPALLTMPSGNDAKGTYARWAYDIQEKAGMIKEESGGFGYLRGLTKGGALTRTTLGGDRFGLDGKIVGDTRPGRNGGETPADNIPFRLSLDGTAYGGSADDGVAYFTGTRDGAKNYHTGLFISTSVGAVLPPESDSDARVHWNGRFGYVSRFNNNSFNVNGTFRLKLNLNATTFTIDRVVLASGADVLEFSGGWNEFGVITGTSSLNTAITGTVTGVIGTEGVVGAFWGNQAAGSGGYAGGFVASGDVSTTISAVPTPTSGKVDYSYWAFDIQTRDGVIEQLISGIGYLQKLSKDGVLSAKTLDGALLRTNGGVNTTTPYRLALADTDDGVAYFSGIGMRDGMTNYHAGLFDSTDVGNTLTGARIAYWNGELGIILGNDTIATHHTGSFTLKVNMSSRTFRGLDLAENIAGIDFTGRWHAQTGVITNGVISRTTDDGTISGTLTGLIGEAGAVAAFRSVNTGADQWVGGFVATASALGPYQAYQSYYDYYSTREGNTQLHTTTTAGGVTGFVAGKADELLDGRVGYSRLRGASCTAAAPCFRPFVVRANGVASSTNGFIMAHGTHTDYFDRYRVGILPTTDLGVNPNVGVATWNGNFYISSKLGTDGNPATTPFVLNVNFGAGTLSARQTVSAADIGIANAAELRIEGVFGNHANAPRDNGNALPGRFGGNFALVNNAEAVVAGGGVTGLIGAQGAIGIFSNWIGSPNFVGGFEAFSGVAIPPPSSPTATTASNIYSAEVNPTNYITDTTRAFRFLPTRLSVFSSEFTHLDHPSTLIASQGLGFASSLDHCGVGKLTCYSRVYYLNNTFGSANAFYLLLAQSAPGARNDNWYRAGILHSTNLGTPPTTGSAVLNGKLYISNQIEETSHIAGLPISFNVDFGNRRITQPTPVNLPRAGVGHSIALGNVGFKTNGVLSGTVEYSRPGERDFFIALNGLIGANSVLGVFHSSAFRTGPVIGGFWASDGNPPPPHVAITGFDFGTVADFSEDTVFGNTVGASCTIAAPCFNTTVRLGGDIDSPNGFGLFHGHHETDGDIYRAGLLLDTDLGRANSTVSAAWTGSIYTSNNLGADGNPEAVPLTLGVNFATGTITTSAPVTVVAATSETIAIEGVFGAHANAPAAEGVLGGVVNYKVGAAAAIPLDLIGSIGEQGVLGVFHGRVANRPLVGGFEAMYTPPAGSITNSAIVYNRRGGQILDSAPFKSNTVASVENVGNVPVTLSRGLTDEDLGGFYSFVSRNTAETFTQNAAYYTGLLDGVAEKVGDVLPATFSDSSTTATWSGTFAMYYGSGRGFTFAREGAGSFSHQDFELKVNLYDKSFEATRFSYGGFNVDFDGKWNEFGAITEGYMITRGVPGAIQGFIGVRGIVGVVASTAPNATISYAGGFIAKPTPSN